MMKVTFLAHSGFLVELERVWLLFDWWKGTLPPLGSKPLAVFASHAHDDHFNPALFRLDDGTREICFFLGKDISLSPEHRARWSVSPATAAKCRRMGGNETVSALGLTVETLPSTDEGVAFVVTAEGKSVFHAGDLNWWHWSGEPDPWNPNMARDFQRYAEPLRRRRIDLAMLPLDPRLGADGFRGPKHFLEIGEIRRFLPMHQWGDFGFTQRFLESYPRLAAQTVPVKREGQTFEF